jgi:hypothetical protein
MQQRNVDKNRTDRKATDMKPAPNSLLMAKQAALKAWPIFGGTSPTDPPKADPPKADPPKVDPPAGGATPPPDPLAELQKDPAKLQQLLSQVATTTQTLATMQTELEGYKTKETEAENAKKTNEQRLQTTIEQKDALLARATLLLQEKSAENALLSHKDYTWHDSSDALINILKDPQVVVTVDIDKQIATVEGMDKALKVLATAKPWMLSAGPGVPDPAAAPGTPPPPSGAPPAAPTTDAQKAARRADLISKHPVIMAGR